MGELPIDEGAPQQEAQDPKKGRFLYSDQIEIARKYWGTVFDTHKNGQDRVNALLSGMVHIESLNADGIDGKKIGEDIKKLAGAASKEEFVEGLDKALAPLIEMMERRPNDFEKLNRESIKNTDNKANFVNDILYYELADGAITLHLLPSKTLGASKIRSLFIDGLKEVAKKVDADPSIKEVYASSWIIARSPELAERFGFQIIKVDKEKGSGSGTIPREEFLKRYLA